MELNALIKGIGESDFYKLIVEHSARKGTNFLRFDFDTSRLKIDASIIAGDTLHNLRSALDILFHEVMEPGTATKYTRFPILETREELITRLSTILEKKQISTVLHNFLRDTVKPYQAGNYPLWALDELNVIDKHKLLLPALQMLRFVDIRLEDENHRQVGTTVYYMDEACSIRLRDADDRKVIIKNKGHAAATVAFDQGTPFENQAIVPTLANISQEVLRTVEAFEVGGF